MDINTVKSQTHIRHMRPYSDYVSDWQRDQKTEKGRESETYTEIERKQWAKKKHQEKLRKHEIV